MKKIRPYSIADIASFAFEAIMLGLVLVGAAYFTVFVGWR